MVFVYSISQTRRKFAQENTEEKFLSVQWPGPCDCPGSASRYIGIVKQAGLERVRSGACSAGCVGYKEYSGLSDGYGFTAELFGRDRRHGLSGTYDHR